MKRWLGLIAVLAVASCAPASSPDLPPLEGFDWLAGCWLSREGVVERWDAPSGGSIHGTSLIPDIDGAQVPQALQIRTTAGDLILFSAQIGDQAERVFPLVSSGPALAVFEDADSPDIQKITYRREGEAYREAA